MNESDDTNRLLKNAHLLRYPYSSSLRRTSMYASLLGISDALHLDVFDQPALQLFFSNLLIALAVGQHPDPLCDRSRKFTSLD
jgi:hypothetical protein